MQSKLQTYNNWFVNILAVEMLFLETCLKFSAELIMNASLFFPKCVCINKSRVVPP
jgi:hypothetical protein